MPSPNRQIYSVDSLSLEIKKLLEMSYGDIWIEGEVSSLTNAASGHSYFTLKDKSSVLKCVLFKGKKYLSAALPEVGERILIRGKVSVYTARGDVQLICSYIEAAGEGELRRQFEMLKQQLATEGLFDSSHKLELPARPKQIALITSPSGAVLHDIISTLEKRDPSVHLRVYPALVQGQQSVSEILQALDIAIQDKPDLIILARGGGSLEDLQAFNDEALARALYTCTIPTISAIGHETDFVISDFVADHRAPTPTGAAIAATPDIRETRDNLKQLQRNLNALIRQRLDESQQRLDFARQRLSHPQQKLSLQAGRLNQLILQLNASHQSNLRQSQQRFTELLARLQAQSPRNRVQEKSYLLPALNQRLDNAINNQLQRRRAGIAELKAKLIVLGPISTLGRGYSILQNQQGEIIKDAKQLKTGEHFQARLQRGTIRAVVEAKED